MRHVIAVVGDFQPQNRTHLMTDAALGHIGLAFEWLGTETIGDEPESRLAGYDGVWIAPSSPYRSMAGALEAIR